MNYIEKMEDAIWDQVEKCKLGNPEDFEGAMAQAALDALIKAVPDLEWETYDHWKYAPADRAIGVNCEYILQDPLDERADWSLVSIPNSGPMKFETLGGYDYSVAEVNTRNRAQVRKLFGGGMMGYEITSARLLAFAAHQDAALIRLMDRFPKLTRSLYIVNEISKLQRQVIALRNEAAELAAWEKSQ